MLFLFLSLFFCFTATLNEAYVSVKLENGDLIGKKCPYDFNAYEYLGIPYAIPPVGDLRFRPTVYYDIPYPEEAFNATKFPHACGTPCDATGSTDVRQTIAEDCLFLNVFVPAKKEKGNFPVRVYIHGGSNRACRASDALLTGCASAAKSETIIVVIQYRLGAFGFLAHPSTLIESNTTGNWGVLDQQMALVWVQRNIAAFGGDPNLVVIHGGSSGASAVALHTTIPGSAGLFRSAITQSATCYEALTLEHAYIVRAEFSEILGCASEDSEAELACIRAADVASITNATSDYTMDSNCYNRNHFMFSPTVDGTTVPMQILEAYASGDFNRVPLMVGVNDQEGSFFIDLFFSDTFNITLEEVEELLDVIYPGVDPSQILSIYPEEDYADADYPMYRRVVDLLGDIFVKCPGYEMLVTHSGSNTPTYSYYFAHTPSCPADSVFKGASHGTELPFVFHNLVDLYPPGGGCNLREEEGVLSDAFQVAWSSMAEEGYPKFQDGIPWPLWSLNSSISIVLDSYLNGTFPNLGKRCVPLDILAQQADVSLVRKKPVWDLGEFMRLEGKRGGRKYAF